MIRRTAREVVLQSLFQMDFSGCSKEQALDASLSVRQEPHVEKAREYAEDVLKGVRERLAEIDEKIGQYAIDWTVERMPATDRNILRIAVFEMLFADKKNIPNVAINEAVEIAKKYGTDESPRFINGILGKMVK
ncbi:MAG: transcription antitermination factor NusB [Phascolarctobacterium sp.]|nr:transcription antitermination factor NusB [Phascolarctobacterium sp.]MCD8174915.1 transcription antitermination factor NusB [Phascolarctobacterium sp.]